MDTQRSSLFKILPTDIFEIAHPPATKAKDPRRDPRKKAVDEAVLVEEKDHKNLTNGGIRGHMTPMDARSNARLAEAKTPIAQPEP